MRHRLLILFLSLLLVLLIASCSLFGLSMAGGAAEPAEPTLIPLQAPLRRLQGPERPLARLSPAPLAPLQDTAGRAA